MTETERRKLASDFEARREEIERRIASMTMYDNAMMRCVFSDPRNYPLVEYLIMLLTGKSLRVREVKVRSVEVERMSKRFLHSRTVFFDVLAEDEQGNMYNFEIQREPRGMDGRRMRFHSAAIDSEMLCQGEGFEALKESFVIVFSEKDMFRMGEPFYVLDRKIVGSGGSDYGPLGDGSHIIVVNGSYAGEDELGRVLLDFKNPRPSMMSCEIMRRAVEYYKEEKEGMMSLFYTYDSLDEEERRYLHEKGLKEGIEIGTEKGIVIGAEKQLESVVIESFKNSIPIETIARISLISVDRVNEILVKHKLI